MPFRPHTNSVNPSSATCCPSSEPLSCDFFGTLFGPNSPQSVGTFIPEGACVRLTAFTLPTGATISIFKKDGGDCGSGATIPVKRCGTALQLSVAYPEVDLCGPGYFVFTSSAPAGDAYVTADKIAPSTCDEGCPPPPAFVPTNHTANGATATVDLGGGLTVTPSGTDNYNFTPLNINTVNLIGCDGTVIGSFKALA